MTKESVSRLVNLKELQIDYNDKITDECLNHLSSLTILSLQYNNEISNEGLKIFLILQNLILQAVQRFQWRDVEFKKFKRAES